MIAVGLDYYWLSKVAEQNLNKIHDLKHLHYLQKKWNYTNWNSRTHCRYIFTFEIISMNSQMKWFGKTWNRDRGQGPILYRIENHATNPINTSWPIGLNSWPDPVGGTWDGNPISVAIGTNITSLTSLSCNYLYFISISNIINHIIIDNKKD